MAEGARHDQRALHVPQNEARLTSFGGSDRLDTEAADSKNSIHSLTNASSISDRKLRDVFSYRVALLLNDGMRVLTPTFQALL